MLATQFQTRLKYIYRYKHMYIGVWYMQEANEKARGLDIVGGPNLFGASNPQNQSVQYQCHSQG